jgi:hypothetical protein
MIHAKQVTACGILEMQRIQLKRFQRHLRLMEALGTLFRVVILVLAFLWCASMRTSLESKMTSIFYKAITFTSNAD